MYTNSYKTKVTMKESKGNAWDGLKGQNWEKNIIIVESQNIKPYNFTNETHTANEYWSYLPPFP